jgi:hypothetical protein
MKTVLHILTRADDGFAREIIAHQQLEDGEKKVVVADLTTLQPDYKQLLENIFAADAVAIW